MRPPITRQPARLHRAGSVPSTAHFPSTARPPKGLANTVGAAHTRVRHGQGAGKTSCTLPQSVVAQPVKAKLLRGCFASLDRFQLRPLRLVLLPPRRWRGSRATKSHFTLDALNRPNTHRRGRWIGFATCPCGLASESGVWGKAPRACFLFLKLLGWM